MPWEPKEFASRHNKKLKGAAASKASSMANAMLREGVPEGVAIATANKHGDKMMSEASRSHAGKRASWHKGKK